MVDKVVLLMNMFLGYDREPNNSAKSVGLYRIINMLLRNEIQAIKI